MAVTPKFICGAECGIAEVGTLSAGTEHWSTVGGTPTVVTSGPSPMRSTRCFRFNPTASVSRLVHTWATAISAPATVVVRFYVYFSSLPLGNTDLYRDGINAGVKFISSDGTIRAFFGATIAASGAPVTTGVWYLIDSKIVLNTTSTADLQVEGVDQAQASVAGSSAASSSFWIGSSVNFTGDFYIDDFIASGTSVDYPIGPGTVAGLYPNGDKTNSAATPTDGNGGHLYSATNDFGKGAGGATALGAQNAESTSWQSLQDPLSTTIPSTFIGDQLGSSTEHLVWTLDDLPGTASTVNGVMLVATTHSATATANTQSMKLKDASNNLLTAWNVLDLSEATITVPTFVAPTAPDAGNWNVAKVNATLIQWGDSTDVNPDPVLDGVCLEVDYVPLVDGRPPQHRDVRQAVNRSSFY